MVQPVFNTENSRDGGLGEGGGLLQEIATHPAQHTAHPSKGVYWRRQHSSVRRIPENHSVNPGEGVMEIRAATRNEPNGTNAILLFLQESIRS
jgi:hypothetical protein